jgi:putative PIN family toxin of toxin-antitoxin system
VVEVYKASGFGNLSMESLERLDRPRVVLDTNVFVAAYWNWKSASAAILRACRRGSLEACVSDEVEREVRSVLRSIGVSDRFYAYAVEILLSARRAIPNGGVRVVFEDPEDNKLLDCALASGADYLITSDEHLLKLRQFGDVRIVDPGFFVRRIGPGY